MFKVLRAAAVMLACALTLAACGGDGGSADKSAGADTSAKDGSESAAGDLDPDGTIVAAQFAAGTSFDPHQGRSPLSDPSYLVLVYDQLIAGQRTPEGAIEPVPMLATEWEFSDDFTSMTLNLRDDVKFRDGTSFDATVVKANFERGKELASAAARNLQHVESVEVVDPQTVTIHFVEPTPDFAFRLATDAYAGLMISPKQFDNPDLASDPNLAGSGQYTLESQTQDRAVFVRDDSYWDAQNRPGAARIEIIAVPDLTARISGFSSGQYDAVTVRPNEFADYESLLDDNEIIDMGRQTMGLYLNTSHPAFEDARVRRALYLAIDREALSEALFFGQARPADQVIAHGFPGHVDALDGEQYDPELAKELLAEAGASDLTFDCIFSSTEPGDSIGLVIQADLAKVGVTMNAVPYAPAESRPGYQNGDHPCFASAMNVGGDPSTIIHDTLLNANNPGGTSAELQELIDAALSLPLDDAGRADAFAELSTYLAETPQHVPAVEVPLQVLHNGRISGLEKSAFGVLGSMHDLRFAVPLAE